MPDLEKELDRNAQYTDRGLDVRAKLADIRRELEDDTHNDHLAIVGIVDLLEELTSRESKAAAAYRQGIMSREKVLEATKLHDRPNAVPRNDPEDASA